MALKHCSLFITDTTGPIGGQILTGTDFQQWRVIGRFAPGFEATIDFWTFKNAYEEIQNAMNATGAATCTISYNFNTGLVHCDFAATTTVRFNLAAQRILGFLPQYNAVTSIIGSFKPWYIWDSTYDYRTQDIEEFEEEPDYAERIVDSGRTYSIGRKGSLPNRNWGYGLEPKENVFQEKATSTQPFVWETFLVELRKGPTPFVVFNSLYVNDLTYSGRDGTYEMIAESYRFFPKQVQEDYFDHWNLDMKTRILSRPNQYDIQLTQLPPNQVVSSSFTPADIDGLVFWFDNRSPYVILDGTTPKVNSLQDMSGKNNNISCNGNIDASLGFLTPEESPLTGSNSVRNWNNYLRWNLALDAGFSAPLFSASMTNSIVPTGFTHISICQRTTTGSSFVFNVDANANTNIVGANTFPYNFFYLAGGEPNESITFAQQYTRTATDFNVISMSLPVNRNAPLIVVDTYDQITKRCSLWINGGEPAQFNATNSINPLSNSFRFSKTLGVPFAEAESMKYNRVLTTDEIQSIQDYAINKYSFVGITASITKSWTPLDLPGIRGWLRADNVTTDGTNTKVEKIIDLANNSFGMVSSGVNRPDYFSGTDGLYNGHPYMSFSNSQRMSTSFPVTGGVNIRYITMGMVCLVSGAAGSGTQIMFGTQTSVNGAQFQVGRLRYDNTAGSGQFTYAPRADANGQTKNIVARFDLSGTFMRPTASINGVDSTTTTLSHTNTGFVGLSNQTWYLNSSGTGFFTGSIAEAWMCTGSLSNNDLLQWNAYVRERYNINT